MLRIRNLKKLNDNEYECEYQIEGKGEWGFVTYNFETKILEILNYAEGDDEDSMFHKRHIPSAIKDAIESGKTESLVMWY